MEIQTRTEAKKVEKVEEIERRKKPTLSRPPILENPMLRRAMTIGGKFLPYLGVLIPLIDRIAPRRDALGPSIKNLSNDLRNDLRNELRSHMLALKEAQVDVSPVIAEQKLRLEKLEEHASELNHSLTNLSEDQLDLADQVRTMAGWVRNATIAGLFLLALLFVLKLVQTVRGH